MGRRITDLTGRRFGRLIVQSLSPVREAKGGARWVCQCDCGAAATVSLSNLSRGTVLSCGCLAREMTSARRRAARVPLPSCSVEGCDKPAREYGRTLCQAHAKRRRVHGSPDVVVSEENRAKRQRASILQRFNVVKPTTYRKLHGRHEHRVIGEKIAGRKLRSDEHVHHIDGDKHNNDPSNLMVLTAVEHGRLHARERGHG